VRRDAAKTGAFSQPTARRGVGAFVRLDLRAVIEGVNTLTPIHQDAQRRLARELPQQHRYWLTIDEADLAELARCAMPAQRAKNAALAREHNHLDDVAETRS
jgi:hypothetical protein